MYGELKRGLFMKTWRVLVHNILHIAEKSDSILVVTNTQLKAKKKAEAAIKKKYGNVYFDIYWEDIREI